MRAKNFSSPPGTAADFNSLPVSPYTIGLWAPNAIDHEFFETQLRSFGINIIDCRDAIPLNFSFFVVLAILPDWDIEGFYENIELLLSNAPPSVPVLFSVQEQHFPRLLDLSVMSTRDFASRQASLREIIFRTETLARLAKPVARKERTVFGQYSFDRPMRKAFLKDSEIQLKPSEFEIAIYLFNNFDIPVERRVLYSLYASNDIHSTRCIDAIISRLRKKLHLNKENGVVINSMRRVGYQLSFVDKNLANEMASDLPPRSSSLWRSTSASRP